MSSVDDETHEDIPLLSEVVKGESPSSPQSPSKAVCRICLEEDTVSNLAQPCACSGTVSFAHHECVQKWVMAKGDRTCEICKEEYVGDFIVPPPAPQQDPAEALRMMGPVRTIFINADGVIRPMPLDMHSDDDEESSEDERRKAGIAWCMTFLMFTTLMLLLHKTMAPPDNVEPVPPGDRPPGQQDPDDVGFPLFLFWMLTRALLIGLPLYMVMRAAQEARRAALSAQFQMLQDSGASWGLVFPSMQGQAELVHIQRDGTSSAYNSQPDRGRGVDIV